MFVEYCAVGATDRSTLQMSTDDISAQLQVDWMPSLPATVASSLVGWPPFLIETVKSEGIDVLMLRKDVGRTERQWKGMLSWMLGVAGTRQVLADEQYRWIAPLSAFYPYAVQPVDLSGWNPNFPPTSLTADRLPGSGSRLRPDYVALRSTAPGPARPTYEWAVAESKGTRRSLTGIRTCPAAWSKQAHNVVLTLDGAKLEIPRHLVIATRVNPNAKSMNARLIQIRAWNQRLESGEASPARMAIFVAAAHLFGLLRNLRLRENARAIVAAVQALTATPKERIADTGAGPRATILERAEVELNDRRREYPDGRRATMTSFETDLGSIAVELTQPVVTLVQDLQRASSEDAAVRALQEADVQLDTWEDSCRARRQEHDGVVLLPFGVEVRIRRF
jgi:hypothetical protein